jgi:predicted DNA-binding transcriptional regulator AlpA
MENQVEISPRVRLMSVKELTAAGFGSVTTIYRRVAQGNFPKPIKVGGTTCWRESAILAFLDKQQTASK